MTTMDALLSGIGMGDQYCAASFPPDFFCYARDDISSELRIEHYSSEMQGVSKKESGPSCRISPTESISINGNLNLGQTPVSPKTTRRSVDEDKTETWSMENVPR